jgi:hypothetical protein
MEETRIWEWQCSWENEDGPRYLGGSLVSDKPMFMFIHKGDTNIYWFNPHICWWKKWLLNLHFCWMSYDPTKDWSIWTKMEKIKKTTDRTAGCEQLWWKMNQIYFWWHPMTWVTWPRHTQTNLCAHVHGESYENFGMKGHKSHSWIRLRLVIRNAYFCWSLNYFLDSLAKKCGWQIDSKLGFLIPPTSINNSTYPFWAPGAGGLPISSIALIPWLIPIPWKQL